MKKETTSKYKLQLVTEHYVLTHKEKNTMLEKWRIRELEKEIDRVIFKPYEDEERNEQQNEQ